MPDNLKYIKEIRFSHSNIYNMCITSQQKTIKKHVTGENKKKELHITKIELYMHTTCITKFILEYYMYTTRHQNYIID
jgi:hypothetical protein